MTNRRRWIFGLLAVGAVAAGLYAARGQILPAAARWLDVGTPPEHVDYVMILPGDPNVRPFVAAALVRAGLARQVLIPQMGTSPATEDGILPPAHEILRRVLKCRGVPEEDIVVLAGRSSATVGDVQALAAFLASSPEARVAVVTNHYHTRRARWILGRVLKDHSRHVWFVSAPTDGFHAGNWWQCEAGFMAITGEYLKLAYYFGRYGGVRYWVVACAVLVAGVLACRRLRKAVP